MSREYFGKDLEAMSFAPNYHQWILHEFAPYIGEDIVEVGAGTGNFSELLLNTQHRRKLVALEPSANMFAELEKRLAGIPNAEAKSAFFGDCGYRDSLDTVFYINVLEHIENDAQELLYVRDSLKSGGYICLFVPALTYLYSNLDKKIGHFRRYHKQSLADLMTASGFKLIDIKYFDMAGILPWYVAFVLFKYEA
ncbi:methyltransferase type 12, partial [Candidatus Thiomargarita nelsonii]